MIVGMFIAFIILPFVLLCSLMMTHMLLKIYRTLKEDFQELKDEEGR